MLSRLAENRLTSIQQGSTTLATFIYDGDGNRIKSTVSGMTTTYLGTWFEWSGSVTTKVRYYYASGQRLAMRVGNGTATSTLTYLLGDHLGSTSLTFKADTYATTTQLYKPWGEIRYQSGTLPTQYTYTGQYSHTTDFGLMFYVARWYDPVLGRFAQADTLVPGAGKPMAWDRYAYALNSPVRYTDPTGHIPCDIYNNCFTLSNVNAQRNLVPKLSDLTTIIALVGVGRGAVEGGALILVGAFVFTANPLIGGGLGVGGLVLGAAESADGIIEAAKVYTLKDFIMGEISLGATGFDIWFDPNHLTITICRSDGERCTQISLVHKENYELIAAQVAALENTGEPLEDNQPDNNHTDGNPNNTDIYLPIIKKGGGGGKGRQNVY